MGRNPTEQNTDPVALKLTGTAGSEALMTEAGDLQALRERFLETHGYWSPAWQHMLEMDPTFFSAYLALADAPVRSGALEPKVRALLMVAVNASTMLRYRPGIRTHVKNAIALGATAEEIMEVLQIISVVGIHSCEVAIPIMLEELEEAGLDGPPALSETQEETKRQFIAERGWWSPPWEAVLAYAPEFFEGYLTLSTAPWRNGVLEPKVKHFVYIAHSASTTNLHESGIRGHMGLALRRGASREEILEVLELTSLIGMNAMDLAMPILAEESSAN
jgi:alkylhydroperoxidase/carboxymuconolactone decarboxylase family protein YurZ